jgi:hypothetical protein
MCIGVCKIIASLLKLAMMFRQYIQMQVIIAQLHQKYRTYNQLKGPQKITANSFSRGYAKKGFHVS